MANRLHPDNAKGQSTWADIDDDDEDWAAPEAITWTDGTKTTIPHVDETANTPEQSFVKEVKPVEKPRSPAPPPPTTTTTTSGSPAVKPSGLASGKGLVLKGGASSEKPTLVAKPPAPPTPVKSPWAALPPMPKVSPMDVPPEQPVRGFPPPSQAYGSRVAMAPSAREIAPDDFSRSPRRDNQQLFNSQSGRYEPVPDRRGMARSEYHPRQPAVLQRPMHSESQGPAEPSAAFQTTHTSGGYGRRRGSSNVSGGSGSFARPSRPYDQSMGPPDALNARRPSVNSVGDHPMSPETFSPSVPAGNSGPPAYGGPSRPPGASPWQARVSPAMSTVAPQIPGANDVQAPPGPGGPPIDSATETVEYQKRLMKERREAAIRRRQELEAKEEAEKRERLAKKLEALGPAPERKSAKKDTENEASTSPATQLKETPENDASQAAATAKPSPDAVPAAKESGPSSLSNGVPSTSQPPHEAPAAAESVPTGENRHGHQWQPRLPEQPERIWGPGSQSSRNVWGSPNDRSLGNGTFNSVPDAQLSQIASIPGGRPAPGPIGPPRAPGPASPAGTSSRLGPIGPPQRNGPRSSTDDEKEKRRSRWAQAVQENDEEVRVEQRTRNFEKEREMKARGLTYSDLAIPIQDQWTETNEDGHAVRRESTTYGTSSHTANPWPVSSGGRQRDDRQRVVSSQSGGHHGPAGAASQQSRFFPPSWDTQQPAGPDNGRPKSPSPPPPEEDGIHPAFDGDALHPHVSLPKTKPIVKLPPAPVSASTSQRPTSTWGQPSLFRDSGVTHAHPLRSQFGASNTFSQGTNAQIVDRIKNLFADKPSTVNSSSRTAMPQTTYSTSATVSLPGIYAPSTIVDDSSLVTKTMDEDCFEEQEMGSLPPVHLPTDVPDAAWAPAKFPPKQDRRLLPVAPTTVESWVFLQEGRNVYVHLPNNAQSRKTVVMATRGSSNRGRGSRGGLRYGSSYRGGNRGRDTSASYSPEQTSNSSPAPGRGGRGHRGRTSDNWGRAAATPAIHTQ